MDDEAMDPVMADISHENSSSNISTPIPHSSNSHSHSSNSQTQLFLPSTSSTTSTSPLITSFLNYQSCPKPQLFELKKPTELERLFIYFVEVLKDGLTANYVGKGSHSMDVGV